MRARRLPTGGLVSLGVVLAAIGVVVVAGAPPPRTRVDVERHTTTIVRTVRTVVRVTAPTRPARARRAVVVVVERAASSTSSARKRASAPSTRSAAPRSVATTSTTTSTTTTTPRTAVTTTVPPRPSAPSSRTGEFEGGSTSETARVDAVQLVTVVVPSGIQVSLRVSCGLVSWSATAMTTATVHVVSGGAACTATFSIPATAPQPARWRLTTA